MLRRLPQTPEPEAPRRAHSIPELDLHRKRYQSSFEDRDQADSRCTTILALSIALLFTTLLAPTSLLAKEVEKPAAPVVRGKYATQLASECDALIESAIKTSYGWGWGETAAASDDIPVNPIDPKTGKPKPRPKVVKKARPVVKGGEIDVRETAAAGLLLHLAGEQLDEPKFSKAATEAARALAAVQNPTGQIPTIGVLGAQPNGKVETALIPARSSTCASMGLLLTVVQSSEKPDERISRAAVKAAHWIIAQQTEAGNWLTIYPPGAEAKDAKRIVRLDLADSRDAAASLMLAAQVLDDATIRRRGKLAVKEFLSLRLAKTNEAGHQLWATVYMASGDVVGNIPQFPLAVDTLASKYAMQALLADALLDAGGAAAPADSPKSAAALVESSKSLAALPRLGVGLPRLFDFDPAKGPIRRPPEPKTADNSSDIFGDTSGGDNGPEFDVVQGVTPLLAACNAIGSANATKYRDRMDEAFLVQHRVALLLSGLGEDVLTMDFPTAKTEVDSFVQKNASLWSSIEGESPRDLISRLERLRSLLIRVKIEQL